MPPPPWVLLSLAVVLWIELPLILGLSLASYVVAAILAVIVLPPAKQWFRNWWVVFVLAAVGLGLPIYHYQTSARLPEPGPDTPPPQERPATQALSVVSSPAGAKIMLEGARVGTTPDTLTLSEGLHLVSLELEGFVTLETTVRIPDQTVLYADLEPAP